MATYYVSNAGNDAAAGTSEATAWQTVARVNAVVFPAGEPHFVLFRGGDTFSGTMLYLQYAGTSSMPITVGSYGTGRATLSHTSTAVYGYNVGGLVVQDLNITGGVGASSSDGLGFYRDTPGRASFIRVSRVSASGWQNGISIGGAGGGGFADVWVDSCSVFGNRDAGLATYGPTFNISAPAYAHSSVTVTNTAAYSNLGNSANTTGNSGSGIILGSVDGALVWRCSAYGNGSLNAAASEGPVGIWAYSSNAVVFQECLSYDNSSGTNADGGGFDLDIHTSNSYIEYCLAYGNRGYGILLFGQVATTSTTGNVVRYNLCWGNGEATGATFGELTIVGPVQSSAIYHNTFVARDNASVNPMGVSVAGGAPTGVTLRNNIIVTQSGLLVYSETALTTTGALFQGNLWWSAGTTYWWWVSTGYTSLTAWRAVVTGQEQVSGGNTGLVADPLLTAPTVAPTVTDPALLTSYGGLRVLVGSPATTGGLDLPGLLGVSIGSRDYAGNPPTVPYSIGAIETFILMSLFFAAV